jgi:hypothetical protein
MKVEIPAELKADIPQSNWGKILSATPVVMAVLSTMLAGLASSEMTRAQYARSLAAQQQSKAGDQWSFFQAKRLRGSLQQNAADLLLTTSPVRPFQLDSLRSAVEKMDEPAKTRLNVLLNGPSQDQLQFLFSGKIPALPIAEPLPQPIVDALKVVEDAEPDAEIEARLAKVNTGDLEKHVKAARERAREFDGRTGPVNAAVERLEQALASSGVNSGDGTL